MKLSSSDRLLLCSVLISRFRKRSLTQIRGSADCSQQKLSAENIEHKMQFIKLTFRFRTYFNIFCTLTFKIYQLQYPRVPLGLPPFEKHCYI